MSYKSRTGAAPEGPDQIRSPFRRPMPVARLPRDRETQFRVAAERGELDALAPYLGVARIDRLTLAGFVSPEGPDDAGGWRIRGRLVASLDQTCVVTLQQLHARHEAEIERSYLPAEDLVEGPEIRIFHDDEDLPDGYEDDLDPAQLAVESLLLMIDPYPRAEGAELAPGRFVAGDDGAGAEQPHDRPFAALAALKSRNGSGGEPEEG